MKSVGEAMAIGRTFKESFQKAMRSFEIGLKGFDAGKLDGEDLDSSAIRAGVKRPSAERPQYLYKAFEAGMTPEEVSSSPGSIYGSLPNSDRFIRLPRGSKALACLILMRNPFERPRRRAFPIASWLTCGNASHPKFASVVRLWGSILSSGWLTPAPRSSRLILLTITRPTEKRTNSSNPIPRRS